ncbi:lipid IV(A) 3-deoxy-D-manno-octulosonic acid transferase [Chromohalobacter canadensis]|uniref:3-deoxy-D-manno-octulosonic acid transferase n=1 Tax=Chromohalobacter canadensis TaxID=141389 RepID=A0ABZ0Y6P3_9GAMM|nr:lipid IV(A) 3-deoxy-D-manno-octulosonic acid transferase [Chromohalobacter canadensis]MCK0769224.1 lipid IV(A) 3-deoxy-D-manno-octulosonic acid transferase [Chromohalobacter canadensis]WQH07566.1 lipid IV(A) 3-deoxy-D-manno-octulosonic acid transferase [Chromohalobacter canadensis]
MIAPGVARGLYSALLYLLSPLVWWRVWREHALTNKRAERLGLIADTADGTPTIWLHAASVGEVLAARPLIEALALRHADHRLVVTTMTATGAERVRALFPAERYALTHYFLPLDFPGAARRFVKRLRPRLAIIVETELWPNLLAACERQHVPVVVANARLSDKAFQGYRKVAPLLRGALGAVSWLAAKSPADLERFTALGLAGERGDVVGSIKFDLPINAELRDEGERLHTQWGARFVWVAGSTHEGEDEQVLAAHARLRRTHPQALLVLVPRHPQRFSAVAELCEARGECLARRSQGETPSAETSVLLGDTMGELMRFYAAADAAFVGGSLVPIGGHNLLEPAALGVPVLTGPHLENFQDIAETLREAQALCEIGDAEALGDALATLADDPDQRRRLGAAGEAVVAANRGALEKTLEGIAARLPADVHAQGV